MHFGTNQYTQKERIDLGNEPPIVLKSGQRVPFTNQNAYLRWFIGTVLTAVTTLVLIISALIIGFDTNFSLAVISDSTESIDDGEDKFATISQSTKRDRKLKIDTQFSNRKNVQINTLEPNGFRNNVVINPFVLVTSTLHTKTDAEVTKQIPSFDPLILSQIETGEINSTIIGDTIYDAEIKGNVAVSVLDFPLENAFVSPDLTYSSNDIQEQIRNDLFNEIDSTNSSIKFASVNPKDQSASATTDSFENYVKIETENVSYLQKSNQITKIEGLEEIYDVFREGDSFEEVLLEHGFTELEAQAVLRVIRQSSFSELPLVGQRLRLAFTEDKEIYRKLRPIRMSLYSDHRHILSVAATDSGHFVIGEAPSTKIPSDAYMVAKRATLSGQRPTIYNSIYQTALKQKIPRTVIDELIRLYLYELDFNSKVRVGDSFQILFELKDEYSGEPPEILYSSLSIGGVNRTFFKYQIPNSGIADYFDENGKSASKFLIRKPVLSGNFKSGFGMRRHPILGDRRMHNGVDWSAIRGTKVIAAGDGTVEKAHWISGFGKRVEIRHADGYLTTYSHLQEFSEKIKRGAWIKQGELVGHVGSTGLSSGSHLHYEILINNKYVDPMRIRLPRVQELSGANLENYTIAIEKLKGIIDAHTSDKLYVSRFDSTINIQ